MKNSLIEKVSLARLEIPLVKPYQLSFGTIKYFDTIVCRIECGGNTYLGETTTLPGYSNETIKMAWEFSKKWANHMVGLDLKQAFNDVLRAGKDNPFCAVSLLTALEGDSSILNICRPGKIPATATLLQKEENEVGGEAERLSAQGYKKIKLKIGDNIKYEVNKINGILKKIPKNTKLRLDANQCLTLEKAINLWEGINHQQIEYIEQPFPRGDWGSLQRFCKEDQVRICLDESIFSMMDLKEMEKLDYHFWVKLKLMKMGSVSELVRCVKWLKERDYPIILGNGVQSDLGSFFEYSIYKNLELNTAAELNGFAKQKITPFNSTPLTMQDGYIVFNGWKEKSISTDDNLNIIKDFWEKSF